MKIPTSFKTKIEETFDDKVLTLYANEVTTEADGWTHKKQLTSTGTFKGNVNFANLARIREDYGIKEDINMTVTTPTNVPNGQIIGYLDKHYEVVEAKPFDSHYLLIAKLWSSRSSTLISA